MKPKAMHDLLITRAISDEEAKKFMSNLKTPFIVKIKKKDYKLIKKLAKHNTYLNA